MKENTSSKCSYSDDFYSDGFQTRRYKNHRYENRRNKASQYLKILIACSLLLMVSCKAKKQLLVSRVATDSSAKRITDLNIKLDAIRAKQSSFSTFSGKAKAKLNIGGNTNDVTLNIRINRDQKIWVSITAIAGIEVARALITPDSVLIINRLESVYLKKPFSYIYKFTGDQVNYKTLESLLMGNAIPELLNANSQLQNSNNDIILTGDLRGLVYKLLIGPDMRVTQTNLSDPDAGQSLQVTNSAFIQASNRVVPSQIDMDSMVKDKKIKINLHYIKLTFEQSQEYPFNIPASYTPVQ